jgi:hypothetical protein
MVCDREPMDASGEISANRRGRRRISSSSILCWNAIDARIVEAFANGIAVQVVTA